MASLSVTSVVDQSNDVLDETWTYPPRSPDRRLTFSWWDGLVGPPGSELTAPAHAATAIDAGTWPVWHSGDTRRWPLWVVRFSFHYGRINGNRVSSPGGMLPSPDGDFVLMNGITYVGDPEVGVTTSAIGFVPTKRGPTTATYRVFSNVAHSYVTLALRGVGAVEPILGSPDARNLTTNSAVLSGTVDPGEVAASAHFEYGTTAAYGASTPDVSIDPASGTAALTQALSGLEPGSTYHFRLVAKNAIGTSISSDVVFTTASKPLLSYPTRTVSASRSRAILVGAVDTGGFGGVAYFQYGRTARYGSRTRVVQLAPTKGAQRVRQSTARLLPATTYHFRVIATTVGGTARGADRVFTTKR